MVDSLIFVSEIKFWLIFVWLLPVVVLSGVLVVSLFSTVEVVELEVVAISRVLDGVLVVFELELLIVEEFISVVDVDDKVEVLIFVVEVEDSVDVAIAFVDVTIVLVGIIISKVVLGVSVVVVVLLLVSDFVSFSVVVEIIELLVMIGVDVLIWLGVEVVFSCAKTLGASKMVAEIINNPTINK